MRRTAIIGGGVSGVAAALCLKDRGHVTLHERAPRLGGHANTLRISYEGAPIDVDTGFIVFNEHNYPQLTSMLAYLGVETIASDMSFSVSNPAGFEWSSRGFAGLFAWKRNICRADFLCMLGEIVRFSAAARADLQKSLHDRAPLTQSTIAQYVDSLKLSRGFLSNYLLPMGAAIWSTAEREMMSYPAHAFLRFFDNHRLLHLKRPRWRAVKGGSGVYVAAAARALGERVRLGDGALSVRRDGDGALVRFLDGREERFDHVILACHADQALALLENATNAERQALAAVRFAPNVAYLHRDARLMPKRRAAWASWNYLSGAGDGDNPCVSYWMNKLQAIDEAKPLFVTLNPAQAPADELCFARIAYDHPQFDAPAIAAQKTLDGLDCGALSFAGAWRGFGFHEDGLVSGVRAAAKLGGAPPWSATGAEPGVRAA